MPTTAWQHCISCHSSKQQFSCAKTGEAKRPRQMFVFGEASAASCQLLPVDRGPLDFADPSRTSGSVYLVQDIEKMTLGRRQHSYAGGVYGAPALRYSSCDARTSRWLHRHACRIRRARLYADRWVWGWPRCSRPRVNLRSARSGVGIWRKGNPCMACR